MFKGLFFFVREGWKYDKRYILWLVLYQLTNSLIPVAAALMPKFIIDELTGARRTEYLVLHVAIFAGYALLAGALSSFFSKDGFSHRCRVDFAFSAELHRRLTLADYANLESPAFRDMKEKANKFLSCDWHGFGYLLDCALNIIGQAITLIGLCAILSTLNFGFVMLFVALAVLSAWIEGQAKKKAMAISMKIAADQRRILYFFKLFDETRFAKEIRLGGMADWLLKREKEAFGRNADAMTEHNNCYIRSDVLRSGLTFVQQAAAYAFLIVQVLNGRMGIGSFTMCVTAVTAFAAALRAIMDSFVEIRAYDMYYDKLDEYLSVPCTLREGRSLPLPQESFSIEFRNVGFRYPGAESWALKDVSFTLHPGERLSVVGENGSGKTTLIKLLCRLYDPTEGVILLNGTNIRDFSYDAYLSVFSTVFQDFELLDFSLRENVTLGHDASDAEVTSLLERVGLSERLRTLPRGLDTPLGREFDEQGVLPSGGEAQKIALARALFKDAPVVVLDEPTAALDPRAEYELYRSFDALIGGKTAVYISHRMSSCRFCDRIAVLAHGQLVEYGTHDELMQRSGHYAELYSLQSQYYI